MLVEDEDICWQVAVLHQSWCCCRYSGANCKESNRYCIRAGTVVGTVVPTVREVTGTESELVLL